MPIDRDSWSITLHVPRGLGDLLHDQLDVHVVAAVRVARRASENPRVLPDGALDAQLRDHPLGQLLRPDGVPLVAVARYVLAPHLPQDLHRRVPQRRALQVGLLPFHHLHLFRLLQEVSRRCNIRHATNCKERGGAGLPFTLRKMTLLTPAPMLFLPSQRYCPSFSFDMWRKFNEPFWNCCTFGSKRKSLYSPGCSPSGSYR
jgi:hypothetical protein